MNRKGEASDAILVWRDLEKENENLLNRMRNALEKETDPGARLATQEILNMYQKTYHGMKAVVETVCKIKRREERNEPADNRISVDEKFAQLLDQELADSRNVGPTPW